MQEKIKGMHYFQRSNMQSFRFFPFLHAYAHGYFFSFTVKKVSGKTALLELLEDNSDQFDFCMCNPPFFADHMDAQAIMSSRSDDRPEPSSINTASVGESITEGGEAEFIKKIIVESVELQGRIK